MRQLKTKRHWYAFRGKNSSGEIAVDLMEEIGGFGITAKQFKEDLARAGSNQPLHVHINSDGGDIIQGLEMYNILQSHEGHVRVSVGALAASISSVVAMAGDTISIAENGWLMVHDPWSIIAGDSEEMRKTADTMDKMKASIVKAYQRQSGLSAEDIGAMMTEETWLDAEDALDKGLVDSIDFAPEDVVTAVNDLRVARSFALEGFNNTAAFKNSLKENRMSKQKTDNGNGDDPPPSGTELLDAERNRVKEIMDLATSLQERDHKNFFGEAHKAIQDGLSPADFSKVVIKSEKYKSIAIIGGGPDFDEGDVFGNVRGFGALVVKSEAYQAHLRRGGSLPRGSRIMIDVPKRNIMEFRGGPFRNVATPITSTGLTSIEKVPDIAYLGLQPVTVADLCAQFTTTAATVRYIKETSYTIAAAPVGEGVAKPEQKFNFAEADAVVRKIAAWTKLTDEVVADQVRMASFVNQKLQATVMLVLDQQILNGDGTGVNLLGILNSSGIQTQAKGTDANADAVYKAITKVRSVGFFEPDGIVMNPNDFAILKLTKDTNGQYLGGGPFYLPYGAGGVYVVLEFLWGKPVAITTAIPAGTALVGAFKIGAEVYNRQGLTVDITNSNEDDFIKNLLAIRAELRATLAVPHPQAFCTVTGIA